MTPTGSEKHCKTKGYVPTYWAESNVRQQSNTTNLDTSAAIGSRSCLAGSRFGGLWGDLRRSNRRVRPLIKRLLLHKNLGAPFWGFTTIFLRGAEPLACDTEFPQRRPANAGKDLERWAGILAKSAVVPCSFAVFREVSPDRRARGHHPAGYHRLSDGRSGPPPHQFR